MPSVSRGFYRWLFQRSAVLEDFADRLSHVWTVGLLLLLACIISWRQCYHSSISCWSPSQFTGSMQRFEESVCWNSYAIQYHENLEQAEKDLQINVSDPFWNPLKQPIVSSYFDFKDPVTRRSTTVTLYQWLPFILCFQALLFKLPNIVLYAVHGFTGISFDKLAGLTRGYDNLNLQDRQLLGRQISRYVYNWCQRFHNLPPWRLLTFLWLFVKILYLVNVSVQLRVLNAYVTPGPPLENETSYGRSITDLFKNSALIWKESPAFPRFIFCEFSIVSLQNLQFWRVPCHLPANVFNEQVFNFLWVWLVFVTTVTSLSLAVWLVTTLLPFMRKRYVHFYFWGMLLLKPF